MTLDTGRMDVALEAALKLAATKPWGRISLAEIARESHKTLSDFYGEIAKDSLVAELDKRLDKACSSEPTDPEDGLRERVFEAAMLRFEAMEDQRAAVLSIRRSWSFDPVRRLKAAQRRTRTAKWILTCAEDDGPGLSARSLILSGILYRAEEAWAKETSPDFTRTMSQLDRDLRDVMDFVDRLKKVSPSGFRKPESRQKKEATESSVTS